MPVFFARATMTDRKAVIKNADMSEDMQQDAVECATQALEKYNIEKDIAAFIKKVKDAIRHRHLSSHEAIHRASIFLCVFGPRSWSWKPISALAHPVCNCF